ncbi:MAG: glycosyltransferase [ANME-2 cluster archaeon]|nr:MAG: glycosyltransferase [ANME-2 cluster archaeon]
MTAIQKQRQTNSLDVSVVVCTKNEESRIEDCLKSIVNNNPGEIIVVDGESTDTTIDIAKKYTNKVIH